MSDVTGEPYSDELRRLFAHPEHAGEVQGGVQGVAEQQGVRVRLTMAHFDDRIDKLRFQAWGCPHLLAACEWFCATVETRSLAELRDFERSELMQSLAVPVEKTGRILVLEDAVRLLWAAVRDTST